MVIYCFECLDHTVHLSPFPFGGFVVLCLKICELLYRSFETPTYLSMSPTVTAVFFSYSVYKDISLINHYLFRY